MRDDDVGMCTLTGRCWLPGRAVNKRIGVYLAGSFGKGNKRANPGVLVLGEGWGPPETGL